MSDLLPVSPYSRSVGLRRANVGGFGGMIPQQTSGSGFG
jgi:hypothetical protein